MWPFSSAAYVEIARRKQARREDALRIARSLSAPDAEPYLRATGSSSFFPAHEARAIAFAHCPLFFPFGPTAKEIVQRIAKGDWTASDVLDAYLARAVLAQDVTNCLTEGQPRSYSLLEPRPIRSPDRQSACLMIIPTYLSGTFTWG